MVVTTTALSPRRANWDRGAADALASVRRASRIEKLEMIESLSALFPVSAGTWGERVTAAMPMMAS